MSECKICGKPIANVRGAWKEQVGWVSPKGAKGMTLAQQTGALAHDECVTLKRFGVNPEQASLVEFFVASEMDATKGEKDEG